MNNINDILKTGKVGVDISIDKETAVILALSIIVSIIVGGLLLKMLTNAFNLD